jgi:hypothetical protein
MDAADSRKRSSVKNQTKNVVKPLPRLRSRSRCKLLIELHVQNVESLVTMTLLKWYSVIRGMVKNTGAHMVTYL